MGNSETIRVVVVDDSQEDRENFERLFREWEGPQVEITEFALGGPGLEFCRSSNSDCVLLDYRLPDIDGIEFLNELRRANSRPPTPVIMLTGQGSEPIAVQAMKLGAADYLIKGEITPEALYRSVTLAIEKVEIEHTLAKKQEDLEQFAYVASHDLKAPLASVQMAIQLLKESFEQSRAKAEGEVLEIMDRSVERMLRLVTDLLEYARATGAEHSFENVNLEEVVANVLENLEVPLHQANAKIEYNGLPAVWGIRTGYVQIFQNLIANAVKFRGNNPPVVRISSTLEESGWHFTVADNGIGIPHESHQDVFAPLRKLHAQKEFEGTGLGLATCKKIVERHGGEIWVESEPGKGAVIHFAVPATSETGERKLRVP